MLKTKGLWAEDIDDDDAQVRFIQHVKDTGANLVCVRTTSPLLRGLIPTFHQVQIKVFGWMWARVVPNQADHRYARDEANFVASELIPAGLDGYIFDVESDDTHPPSAHDWDRTDVEDLTELATYYSTALQSAFIARQTPYLLGLTSHARGFSNYPGIPWKPFLDTCSVLYPQTYWRYNKGENQNKNCVAENADPVTHLGAGTPAQALVNGFKDYNPKRKPIVPIAGEIGCAKPGEMTTFGHLVAQRGLSEAHFYVDVPNAAIPDGALQEIRAL